MMDRHNRERDNAGGRNLHTYTPRSHEDLLRSHLQLDANRNARLQNELQRLADENKKLRRDLDNAQKDIKDQEHEIDNLKNKLREKPPTNASSHSAPGEDPKLFELDGKPVTLEQIIRHFDGVIQKHHDLLDRKNQQISDLEEALRNRGDNQPEKRSLRNIETQFPRGSDPRRSDPREDHIKTDDFARELVLIRKEYEQVENILTERNNKLENLIEDLKRKLDQYSDEIGHLRQELGNRGMDPNEHTMALLREKEKENDYLKDIISSLKIQPGQNVMLPPPRRKSSDPRKSSNVSGPYMPYWDDGQGPVYETRRTRSLEATPESSLMSFRSVHFRPVTPEVSFRQLPAVGPPRDRLYPELPTDTHSPFPKRKGHAGCEACEDNYPIGKDYHDETPYDESHDEMPHGKTPHEPHGKPKKKAWFGRKRKPREKTPEKGTPHERSPDYEDYPEKEEEVVVVHEHKHIGFHKDPPNRIRKHHHPQSHGPRPETPEESHPPGSRSQTPEQPKKSKHKLISKLKPDKKKD